jgi:hypothetical protein
MANEAEISNTLLVIAGLAKILQNTKLTSVSEGVTRLSKQDLIELQEAISLVRGFVNNL